MRLTYHNSDTEVLVGDHVEFKTLFYFWRGWQPGRVEYVPGQSPKNEQLEHGGLTWICVRGDGMKVGVIVYPETHQVKKTVRFVRRTTDDLKATPSDFAFEPDN